MSLEMCVLGSGSSGNATVIRSAQGALLIDAGFGPRTTAQRLHGIGMQVSDIQAIVLTHLDSDHFNFNWLQTIVKNQIAVHCAASKTRTLLKSPEVRDLDQKLDAKKYNGKRFSDLLQPFTTQAFEPLPHVIMKPLELAHDEDGSHGFSIESHGYKVSFATDLGHVPDSLIAQFCGSDVLAIESNYDPHMERNSERPWYLKQRVMGGKGHLSNDQALAAVTQILDQTALTCGPNHLPRHIVLLHRSQECNCPNLVKKMFTKDPRISGILTLTHQEQRTAWLAAGRPRAQVVEQLALAFG